MKSLIRLIGMFGSVALFGCGGESHLWKQSDFPLGAEYSYVVKVVDPITTEGCSGVLLSPTTVLTAAHCLNREGNFVILASSGATVAKEVARLGNATADDTADIALLATQDPLSASHYPAVGEALKVGETVKIAGFGCRDWATRSQGGAMQAGENEVGEINRFAYLFTPLASLRKIVGSAGTSGLCAGDSGAPMVRSAGRRELVGLGHAIAQHNGMHVSLVVDLTQREQRDFLRRSNERFGLGIQFSPTR